MKCGLLLSVCTS